MGFKTLAVTVVPSTRRDQVGLPRVCTSYTPVVHGVPRGVDLGIIFHRS